MLAGMMTSPPLVAVLCVLALVFCCSSVSANDASCEGRCGFGTDATKPCQCNSFCTTYHDCCSDYYQQCVATCRNRCDTGVDSGRPCQCNTHCLTYGDCCDDYQQLCTSGGGGAGTCESLADVTEFFWANDVNRMTSSELTVDWQQQVNDGNTQDQAPRKLFQSVDEAAYISRPTVQAFVALLDNYDSLIGSTDFLSAAETKEIDAFYNLIVATPIFTKLYDHLLCRGHVSSEADFRTKFYNMWFDLYGRSSSASAILDSSGFEHVMVGELRVSGGSQSVSGFHSWIQFYEEEKKGSINYYGYVRGIQTVPYIIGANFAWRPSSSSADALKSLGSFLMGSSPEMDLALYTLCAFEFPNAVCNARLGGGVSVRVQTWDIAHKAGLQIGSAYPAL